LEYLGIEGKIILKGIFKKWVGGSMGWIYLTRNIGPVAVCCGCGNELPVSVKCGEFLD
jgi:hypothetical protein